MSPGPLHLETNPHVMVLMMDGPLNGLPEAMSVTEGGEIRDHGHPGFHPLLQTEVLKAIKVCYPQHLQCHPSQTTWMNLDVLGEAGGIEKRPI